MSNPLPTKNRAVIYAEPGTTKTSVVELPIEELGPGQILVRLLYSGVCHTDYAFCTNAWTPVVPPTAPGQVGGHEGIGQVYAHGPGVNFPPLNSHVGIRYAASSCLTCDRCLAGGETSCLQAKVSGFYTPGTFQQFVVSDARCVTLVPEGLDMAMASPLMCGGVTVYTALKRSNTKFNDWVLVSGAGGGLGHLGIQYAKAMGARVIALDAPSKESFCKSLGADHFLDFTKFSSDEALTEEVLKLSGKNEVNPGGVNTVLLCSSSNKAYAQAMNFLGFRGTLVVLGVPEHEPVAIAGASPFVMINNELNVIALKAGNRQDARECLEIAARGLVKTHYELRPMESLTEVFEEMHSGKTTGRIVLDLR